MGEQENPETAFPLSITRARFMARKDAERLEKEAEVLLKCGFAERELAIVSSDPLVPGEGSVTIMG